jgi:hypothetical protein
LCDAIAWFNATANESLREHRLIPLWRRLGLIRLRLGLIGLARVALAMAIDERHMVTW